MIWGEFLSGEICRKWVGVQKTPEVSKGHSWWIFINHSGQPFLNGLWLAGETWICKPGLWKLWFLNPVNLFDDLSNPPFCLNYKKTLCIFLDDELEQKTESLAVDIYEFMWTAYWNVWIIPIETCFPLDNGGFHIQEVSRSCNDTLQKKNMRYAKRNTWAWKSVCMFYFCYDLSYQLITYYLAYLILKLQPGPGQRKEQQKPAGWWRVSPFRSNSNMPRVLRYVDPKYF